MNIKIANMELTNDERLYGSLIKDLEKMGYLVVAERDGSTHYIITRQEERGKTMKPNEMINEI